MLLEILLVACNMQNPMQRGIERPKIEAEEVKAPSSGLVGSVRAQRQAANERTQEAESVRPRKPVIPKNRNRSNVAGIGPEASPRKTSGETTVIEDVGATCLSPDPKTPEAPPSSESPKSGAVLHSVVVRSNLAAMPLSWGVVAPEMNELAPGVEEVISKYLDQKQDVQSWEWRAALARDEAVLRKQPGNNYVRARVLFLRGQLARSQGDAATALAHFNEATLVMPDSYLGPLGAGSVHLADHSAPEAIKAFQRALLVKPNLGVACKWLGDAYQSSQRNKEAIKMYERALELGFRGPGLGAAMERSQVQNLISERRWEEALFKLQAIAARAPSADVYLIIGQCHEELKQTISAVQAYTKAAELAPQSPISHYRLGALLLDQREYKLASDEIQRAIALDPWGARIDLAMARKKMQEITNKNGR